IRTIRGVRDVRGIRTIRGVRDVRGIRTIRGVRDVRGIRTIRGVRDVRGIRKIRNVRDVRGTRYLGIFEGRLGRLSGRFPGRAHPEGEQRRHHGDPEPTPRDG
ncbi:MAG: hypothetical protein VX546_03355, partial [Myxococcota bacterium]|nr:hypothetical protein [Myxococcota bacterium]